jgi:hypothetical protein
LLLGFRFFFFLVSAPCSSSHRSQRSRSTATRAVVHAAKSRTPRCMARAERWMRADACLKRRNRSVAAKNQATRRSARRFRWMRICSSRRMFWPAARARRAL